MSMFSSISESVNLLSGRERDEYADFVNDRLQFHAMFAAHFNQPFEDLVRETYEDVSATDYLEIIKATGWKPRRHESERDFNSRIKALPIFTQLGLVDGGVDVIKTNDATILDPDLIKSDESPVTGTDTRDVFPLLQELGGERRSGSKNAKLH